MTKRKEQYFCKSCREPFVPTIRHQFYCDPRCALASKVVVGEPEDCWLWAGAKNSQGYGQLTIGGKRVYAHRLAFELERGPLGEASACHSCDTPLCCNPAHLFAGTQADNVADMHAKGRWTLVPVKGVDHGCAKLAEEDVREIRRAVGAGEGIRPTARRFRVSQGAIHAIIRGRTWKHLD